MPRLLKAALLAPIIFAALMLVLISIFYHEDIIKGGDEAQAIVGLAVVGNLLMFNIIIFVFGWPYYAFLKKRNRVTRTSLMLGTFAILFAIGLGISLYAHKTHTWQVLPQAAIYGLCGSLIAWLIWRMGLKPKG